MTDQSDFHNDPLLGLHDLSKFPNPEDTLYPTNLTSGPMPVSESEPSIYDEFLEFADLKEFVDTIARHGKLDELKSHLARALIKRNHIKKIESEMTKTDEQKATEAGYPAITLKYRKMFTEIRESARIKLAHLEEPIWEIIYSSKNSEQSGPSKRNWIVKNKDRYLVPGYWCISSHQSVNSYGQFVASQCIVKFLGEAPESDPESVICVPRRSGRPQADKNGNTIVN